MKICFGFLVFCCSVGLSFGGVDVGEVKAGLSSGDRELAAAALDSCVSAGEEMLPHLQVWAGDDDPRLKVRARNALGKITGQWGSQTGVVWKRSVDDGVKVAKREGRPLLVLHLFGKLDEEFC